jgi:hypothetical protein
LDSPLKVEGQIAVELTTSGGDADLARRIGMDIEIATEHFGREIFFIGKTISTWQALPPWHRSRESGVTSPVIACF